MGLLRRVAYAEPQARIQKIMSEAGTMTEGTQCHECENTHDDWSKDGQHAVSDKHNEGIIERYECGVCGAITEVPRY